MDSCTSTPTWRSHTEPEACSPARRLTSICTHANSYVPCHKLASAPRCVDKTRVTVPCTTCATRRPSCIKVLMPRLHGSSTTPMICYHDTSSTPSSSPTLHRLPTPTTTTTPFRTDEAERLRRALLMSQQRYTSSWTDEAMDDADTIYTTTTTHAWRTRAKTDDDNHSSLIGGPPAS